MTLARPARSPRQSGGFTLLESKLSAPLQRAGTISRAGLVRRLHSASRTPVVVIAAPAGYGKTALVAEWARLDGRRFAWCSLDDLDNDPVVFVAYLAAALGRAGAGVDLPVERPSSPGKPGEKVVAALRRALSSLEAPAVIVVDNVEHLVDRACVDVLAALLDQVPARSQLVLVTRSESDLPFADLRAGGRLLELGRDDLRLSDAEASALLHAAGVHLTSDAAGALNGRCEGWAAGVYLAALAVRASGRLPDETQLGTDRFVTDYIRQEVLDQLGEQDRDFLLQVSVVDRMCGALCDAMLGTSRSASRLSSLARTNLFLVPLDAEAKWFRFHPLFRDMLQGELARRYPDRKIALLGRAIDWYEAHDDLDAAIGCAIAAGDLDQLAPLCARGVLPAYWNGRSATIERWFAAVDEPALLAGHGSLAALGAAMLALWGRAEASDRWASAAFRSDENGATPGGGATRSTTAVLRALLCRDGVERMRKDAQLAVDTLPEGSQLAAAARLLTGFAHFLGGDDRRAAASFLATVDVAGELGANVCASMALAGLSLLATARSELREAEDYARRALEILREAHLDEYAASAFVYAVGARAAMARGGGGAARMNRERADRLVSKSTYALPWLAVLTRLELARLHLASQNPGRAGELLQEIEHIYTRRPNLGIADGRVEQLRHDLDVGRSPDVGWASTMTAAELRLLPLLATHLSFREIAERLHISRNTVKTQAIAVYRKLGVSSRSAAVERARELGLLRNASQRGERPQTTDENDARRNGADGAGDTVR